MKELGIVGNDCMQSIYILDTTLPLTVMSHELDLVEQWWDTAFHSRVYPAIFEVIASFEMQ